MSKVARVRDTDIASAIALAKDNGLNIAEMVIEPTRTRLIFGVAGLAESGKDARLKSWPTE